MKPWCSLWQSHVVQPPANSKHCTVFRVISTSAVPCWVCVLWPRSQGTPSPPKKQPNGSAPSYMPLGHASNARSPDYFTIACLCVSQISAMLVQECPLGCNGQFHCTWAGTWCRSAFGNKCGVAGSFEHLNYKHKFKEMSCVWGLWRHRAKTVGPQDDRQNGSKKDF